VPDSETTQPIGPVFVDPSGRRRRMLRAIATATAIVTAGYLALMLLAVLGAPLPPAGQLPLPPHVGSDAAGDNMPATTAETPTPTTFDDLSSTGPRTTTTSRPAAGPVVSSPAPTTTTSVRRTTRPTEPPGQGKPPTTPPGHG